MMISSPHAHDRSSVERTMYLVCFALLPATLLGFYLFGWPAINLWVLCIASALASELLCLSLAGKRMSFALDGSAILTGWIIAMTLPPWGPWWLAVTGTLFAIVIGKHLYGGLGQNLFNPAMLTRVGLLISFPLEMTTWASVNPITEASAPGFLQGLEITFLVTPLSDGLTGATALGHVKTALTAAIPSTVSVAEIFNVNDALTGFTRGSLGETSALLMLAGGIFLIWKRIIHWYIPVALIVTVAAMATLFNSIDAERYAPAVYHLLSGALMFGAFFIATDPVTSPSNVKGQLIYGMGIGLVTFIIRTWGSFPEAIGFAVLFMNAMTPIIDRYFRPRIYGYNYKGAPLKVAKE
ncbi:RnfABCDGE type electron transport complex subunit D [Amphritea pacifica]|uniref:RnfABCDGE type electron transport complex subunit D n=1 Tax=Amphritea pacifica TaxID=2811233 RepID=UPI001962CF41|nr:RnfABCDGE type electron transport complex subunit D [Amphritea pacifica]MBN1007387.1 RnfABCDGE type electron transport complex subunit D [Amphritea pacifica]